MKKQDRDDHQGQEHGRCESGVRASDEGLRPDRFTSKAGDFVILKTERDIQEAVEAYRRQQEAARRRVMQKGEADG